MILFLDEFCQIFGEKVKWFFEIFVSVVCVGCVSFFYCYDEDFSVGFVWSFYLMGYLLFVWYLLNGYFDVCQVWMMSVLCVVSWNLMNWLLFLYCEEWWGDVYFDVVVEMLDMVCMVC